MAWPLTGQRCGARQVDQYPLALALEHQAGAFAAAQEGATQVDPDNPCPTVVRCVKEGIEGADTCVVDDDVQAAEMRLDLAHGIGHRRGIGHVAAQRQHLLAEVGQAGGERGLVEVDSYHLRPFGDEAAHDGLAHALPGAGDEGHFVVQFHSVLLG
ncbi:hypothetical protein D3C76_839080 [compost metagenome]